MGRVRVFVCVVFVLCCVFVAAFVCVPVFVYEVVHNEPQQLLTHSHTHTLTHSHTHTHTHTLTHTTQTFHTSPNEPRATASLNVICSKGI